MGQQVIVIVIVVAATGYTAWKLLPRGLTRRLLASITALARHAGVPASRLARWEKSVSAGSCGACDSCGGCDDLASAVQPPPDTQVIRLQHKVSR